MSVLADVLAHLPAMRAEAESLMVDTVTFAAPGTETYDDTTGEYVTTPGATIYTGPCRVQVRSGSPSDAAVGDTEVVIDRLEIHVPVSAVDIPPSSVGTITAVGEASDPSLIGKQYRVLGTHAATFKTARRLPVELVTP